MSIFRFSAEFRFFFLLSAFLKMIFRVFWKIAKKKKKKKKISFADTATIDYSKSFGKQSVTSWFAGMRFFRFRSKFESAVSPLGIRNLTLTVMLRVGVQRALPQRGGGGEGGGVMVYRTPAFAPPPFLPSSLYTRIHTHTRTHTHTHSLSLSHTHIHWHSGLPAAAISP